MAGQIIVSSIKTDSDNSFSVLSNTGATIFSANLASGLSLDSFGNDSITSDKIVSVANTKIAGNIVSSQITSVANTQLTGTVTSAQVGSSVYEGMGMRNRIINGDMRIDQRNAGAAVTTNSSYPVDRFQMTNTSDGAFSAQQDSSAPAGFVNSFKVTATTADGTLTTTQRLTVRQIIEGTNISDLAWGSASAKTITISFWVRSSLTGTFGGSLQNGDGDRSYPFTYSISSADTWEQKSVTIAGDTSGTWLTTTGRGILVFFGLGAGPDTSGTAGAWAGAGYTSATGAVSVIGTLNATFYLTGVQLEVGSVATPFERRPYGTELALCQRYFEKSFNQATAPANNLPANISTGGAAYSQGLYTPAINFAVIKRAVPTITLYSSDSAATPPNGSWQVYQSSWASGTSTVIGPYQSGFSVNISSNVSNNTGYAINGNWAASAEL